MHSPADALKDHWSTRLPKLPRALVQLSRLDRPVGWRLLVLPCWMGIALSRSGEAFTRDDAWLAMLFLIGAVAARGGGCTYNDIVDRAIDAQVARTRLRPLPAGLISLRGAWAWLAAQIAIGLGVLLALGQDGAWISLCAIPLVAAYPFMKRITWWPQAWLGLCFSWGALVSGISAGGDGWETGFLFAGCVSWVIAYDTIYALQDREDDALIGVRSTARLFAGHWRAWTMGFYALSTACWLAAAGFAGASLPALSGILALGVGAIIAAARLRADFADQALQGFRANTVYGLAVAACFALDSFREMIAQ